MEIEIFTKSEVEAFNSSPSLNHEEKVYFFRINDSLLEELTSRYKKENIAYFILLYGYFKHSNKFYEINNKSHETLAYIQEKYIIPKQIKIPTRTERAYKERIKKYFKINAYTEEIKGKLLDKAISLSNNFTHRKKIFYALVGLSKELKIEIPSYTELSKIIAIAINFKKQNILDRLLPLINDYRIDSLNEFLEKDGNYKNRWHLTYYGYKSTKVLKRTWKP